MEWVVGGLIVIVLLGVVVGKAMKWSNGGYDDPDYYEREWENRSE